MGLVAGFYCSGLLGLGRCAGDLVDDLRVEVIWSYQN